MAITFQNQEIVFSLKNKSLVRSWIKAVIQKEKRRTGQINFVFTSDEEILKTNIQFLNHNTYTDIITFDYCEGLIINGDIILSVDRIKENAVKYEVDFDTELKRVMIHGVLHLCGYKDKSTADATLMRKKEDAALKIF